VDAAPATDEALSSATGRSEDSDVVRIFLVREQRLAPVERDGGRMLHDAQDLLSARPVGPGAVGRWLDSAIAPLTGTRDARRPGWC
jgi:hypothetical protein